MHSVHFVLSFFLSFPFSINLPGSRSLKKSRSLKMSSKTGGFRGGKKWDNNPQITVDHKGLIMQQSMYTFKHTFITKKSLCPENVLNINICIVFNTRCANSSVKVLIKFYLQHQYVAWTPYDKITMFQFEQTHKGLDLKIVPAGLFQFWSFRQILQPLDPFFHQRTVLKGMWTFHLQKPP